MTDGVPTDDIENGKVIFADLQNKRKVTLFTVAIGNNGDMDILRELNPNMEPLRVEGTDFKKFFTWLSRSVEENDLDVNVYKKL